MISFIKYIIYLFSQKILHYQGLILKKIFTIEFNNYEKCGYCYFSGKNRQCPIDKKGKLICSKNIYFIKLNKIRRGIGVTKIKMFSKCYSYKNLRRLKNEDRRINK